MKQKSVNIIIPAYNAHETIGQTLASIAMQDNVDDIAITVVDDCSKERYEEITKKYEMLNIKCIRNEKNIGCGQSRQVGIDHCRSKYFMFLDADDCLIHPNGVACLLNTIIEHKADVVISNFYEELENGDYFLHEKDDVWMHGKLFRTSFIKKHNVRFSDTRANEDHAFNIIVSQCGAKRVSVDYVTYLWKNNPNSIMRAGNAYINYIDQFIENAHYTLDDLLSRGIKINNIIEVYLQYYITMYGYCNIFLAHQYEEEFVDKYLSLVSTFVRKFNDKITKIDYNMCSDAFYENTLINTCLDNRIVFRESLQSYFNIIESKI